MSLPRADECNVLRSPDPPSRGGRRALAVSILLVVLVTGSVFLVRATSLRGLPAIPEPFDTRACAVIPIPDDENAFTFFRRATDRFVGKESDVESGSGSYTSWSQIPPESLRSLEQNRESLDLWLEGTKRDRAVYIQPGSVTIETLLPVTQRLRTFTKLASLKAMRLRLDGDHVGAWAWIRANLRSGLLAGQNGFPIERLVGISLYGDASAQARHWAGDPGVNAKLLRRALDDVLAAEAIAPDYARIIHYEYYSLMNTLDDPAMTGRALMSTPPGRRTWRDSARLRLMPAYAILRREPERSRRLIRLMIANMLSACELPAEERARRSIAVGWMNLYRSAPDGPTPIAPEDLAAWYETTLYAKPLLQGSWNIEATRRREESARSALIVHLAERLYEKERGRPPSSPEELVGPYLKALPAGYIRISDDPTPPGPSR